MSQYYKVLSHICVFLFGFAIAIDLNLDKCYLEDTTCMVNAFQKAIPNFSKGLPEWGIDVMDIMEFEEPVQFHMAGLSLNFSEGRLRGIRNIIINSVKWDRKNGTIYLEYHAPTYSLSGKYKADGQILILPIKGDGEMKINIKNMGVKLMMFIDEYKKNNKTHVSIKKYNFDFKVEGNARYNLTNLFNGKKELADAALSFMNDNWEVLTTEFGRPLMDAVAVKTFKNVNRFLARAPMEDLSLSYQ
ncbi:circadian clock-controlled protein daywake-like isoform X2 [Maniola jurtina]|uniref:circadian clock-controlled protein daywake-like isoform X2 n=1 Tax=Maniola jurtina TaxID=191418 RepID=UPI001E687126|nr:circadian clock-controlled protein daywake-like isoform X2 [Maniola jurtina]